MFMRKGERERAANKLPSLTTMKVTEDMPKFMKSSRGKVIRFRLAILLELPSVFYGLS
jgi:hypothetical protein